MMKSFFVICILFSSLIAKSPSLDEMIGQMLMVGVSGSKSSEKWVKQLKNDIKNGQVGGIILSKNSVENPKQVKKLISFLTSDKTKYPLFVAKKHNDFIPYPDAHKISQNNTLLESYKIYRTIAGNLKSYGFNLSFAPNVDLSAENPRAYSPYEEIVIAYSSELLEAQKDAGIVSVINHFPGSTNNWKYEALKPYFHFIKYEKVSAIMVGNTKVDILDKKYPASLSKKILKDLLRDKLKFDGVVFSDDMKAINKHYGLKKSVILAINAGVDILVYSSYFTKKSSVINDVKKVIKEAVRSGDIKIEDIQNSYNRIIRLKNDIN